MKKIAWITNDQNPHGAPDELKLIRYLNAQGWPITSTVWDTASIDWTAFNCAIFRSCWDYPQKINQFNTFIEKIGKIPTLKVLNPIEVIRWNTNKRYLLDLEKKGVKIVPTQIISNKNINSPWKKFIIKPLVGANGKYFPNTTNIIKDSEVLIQEYFKEQEYSFIFFNRKLSHWGKRHSIDWPLKPKVEFKQVKKCLDVIDGPLLYARVDGFFRDGQFYLLELELIEPMLFFKDKIERFKGFENALKDLWTNQ